MVVDIIGYYGSNFGDLLMLQGVLNNLPSGCLKVNILSFGILNLADLDYSCNAIVNSYYIRMPLKQLIQLYKEAEVIMWGGGSCFNDVDGTGGVKHMLLAKLVNPSVKIVYYGVGIDIKKSFLGKLYLKIALSISERFAVRDERSFDMIKKYSFAELIDDPIYLNKKWLLSINTSNKRSSLVISYRCINSYFPNAYKSYLMNFLINLKSVLRTNSFTDVYVINADSSVDKNDNLYISKELISSCVNVRYIEKQSLKEICGVIGSSSLVITGRLHLAVVASVYNTPCLLLNYSEKNKQFAMKGDSKLITLAEYPLLSDSNYLVQLISSNKV